ncbi:MAG: DUF4173 domain-containing protein [Paracoccaceae bacterium]
MPLTINGIPDKIAMDAWWLASSGASDTDVPDADVPVANMPVTPAPPAPPLPSGDSRQSPPPQARLWLGLAVVVALADLLFWTHAAGVSLVVFAAAIFAVAAWGLPRTQVWKPALFLGVSALPVVDYVQALSVIFLAAGLLIALVWVRLPQVRSDARVGAALSLFAALPSRWIAPFLWPLRNGNVMPAQTAPMLRQTLRNWGFPLGGGLILASLLLDANPVLAQWILQDFDIGSMAERALFWAGMALLVWPLLDTAPVARSLTLPHGPRLTALGLNGASVMRALIMFNIMIGVQTIMDMTIFLGGAALPQGMSHASYAHRGAYPLLVTALLAGGFALAARPYLTQHKALKPLMLLWLGQNVALCASAMLRAQTYIEHYGLTYLRLHALIWMALVAAGLALTAWQVARAHRMDWLLLRVGALGIGTLYLACFVNFAHVIAQHNISADKNDTRYLCRLGPTATGAIAASDRNLDDILRTYRCGLHVPHWDGWQEWGFRNWRVARYVDQIQNLNAKDAVEMMPETAVEPQAEFDAHPEMEPEMAADTKPEMLRE